MHVAQKCAAGPKMQRFWDDDMHKNKDLKRAAGMCLNATRFSFGRAGRRIR
ncbi:hypothetical protein SS05631_c14060 [Sinorhizobium sp. CCBAU 05631]|nr:hypothetical protein SS05631_c14060 [Sinorhizobium sp. CCBAU 05631]